MEKSKFLEILRKLSKKGYYEILLFVKDRREAHYSEVLGYVTKNKLARSDATVTQALNALTTLGLFRRRISQERPIRTTYELTKEGEEFVRHLTDLQRL